MFRICYIPVGISEGRAVGKLAQHCPPSSYCTETCAVHDDAARADCTTRHATQLEHNYPSNKSVLFRYDTKLMKPVNLRQRNALEEGRSRWSIGTQSFGEL